MIEVLFIAIAVLFILNLILQTQNMSLIYKNAYYKRKLINRNVDISSVDGFWSFLQ